MVTERDRAKGDLDGGRAAAEVAATVEAKAVARVAAEAAARVAVRGAGKGAANSEVQDVVLGSVRTAAGHSRSPKSGAAQVPGGRRQVHRLKERTG